MADMVLTPTSRIWHLPRPSRLGQMVQARLQPPEVSPAAVDEILETYGLALTRPPANLPWGRRNQSLVVQTAVGKHVLKRYRADWSAAVVAHEHSILRHLAAVDFPAPRLAQTPEGRTMVEVNGRFYALFDYLTGTNVTAAFLWPGQRQALIAQAGDSLAHFHQQLAGFSPEGRHHLGFPSYTANRERDLAWHLAQLDDLRRQSSHLVDPAAQSEANWLVQHSQSVGETLQQLDEALSDAPLPRLIIHGDFGLHNLLFQRDGMITVCDFELTRLEWRLVDLVIVLSRLRSDRRRSFMAAYQAVYPLSQEEWYCLPQVWQDYHLRGALQHWRNYFALNGRSHLTAARNRIAQADWALDNKVQLWRLKTAPPAPRIMMVVRLFYPWVGGAERQAHKLAQQLAEKQVSVELVTGWWFRGTPQQEILDGIPIFRNNTLWEFWGVKGLRKLGGYLYLLTLFWYLWRRRADYDLIHVHSLNYHTFVAVLAGRLLGRKVIVKLANSGPASDIKKMRENRQLALTHTMLPTTLRCDRFIALNKQVVRELTAVNIPLQRIIELPNGVETEAIIPKCDYALHTPARLLFVGRLHPQKGLETLLCALGWLRHDHDVHLHLLGDGPLRQKLQEQVDRLGLAARVVFHGEVTAAQVLAHLSSADVFVLPSRAEGISNALLEAMATGLPVLVSAIAGNLDVVTHGENGRCFTLDDPDSLAENLDELLSQPDLRQRLGRSARQTVEQHYSLSSVADRYIALYQTLHVSQEGVS